MDTGVAFRIDNPLAWTIFYEVKFINKSYYLIKIYFMTFTMYIISNKVVLYIGNRQ